MAALGWITVGCVLIINDLFTRMARCEWLWRSSTLASRSGRNFKLVGVEEVSSVWNGRAARINADI
jgi:hypothetical protein